MAIVLLIIFVALMAVGVPIAISMAASSILYMVMFVDTPIVVIAQQMLAGVNKYTLLAIPFFMIAGSLMEHGGISRRLVDFCKVLLGRIPGGLALVTIVACEIFAAMTGAGAATVAAIGTFMIPAMVADGYNKDFAAALTATAGIFGPLIPPSILMVLYSVSTNVSVGTMLIGGIGPGLLMGLMVAIPAMYVCIKNNYRSQTPTGLKNLWSSFKSAIWAIFTPVIILGGIYSGLFTATEAAAVAALYALIVGIFVYKELNLKKMVDVLKTSMISTAGIMLIVAATQAFGWVLTFEQIPQGIAAFLTSTIGNKWVFLIIVDILMLISGCFLDPVPAVMIYAPLLAPVATQFGVDPIHFGVLMVVGLVIGLVTPPVGVNLFVASAIAERPVHRIVPKLIPFIAFCVVGLVIITFVPAISTFLPSLIGE